MAKDKWIFLILVVLVGNFLIPAYAEVNSFRTDKSFYTPGNKIYFTGTVGISDYQKQVNLVIHNPMGKFVLISGNFSDSTYTFEIVVNTNDTTQFSTKGTYGATAFVGTPSEGQTIAFDFSPDGSPVIRQTPPVNNPGTSTGQSSSQHYQTQLNEGIATSDVTGNLTKVQIPPVEKPVTPFDFKSIMYPLIALCGVGIVIAVIYFKKTNLIFNVQKTTPRPSTQTISSEPEDDYAILILKNRLAKGEINLDEFKAIKNELDL